VQVRYALILNEDVFQIAYQREVETTWAMLGPRWEQGDRPAPIAFPWLRDQINAATCVSIPFDEGLASGTEQFELDRVSVVPRTLDLTDQTHYPWVGCDFTKAGWLVPDESDAYDRPTITYIKTSDIPLTIGIVRKAFTNSVFDVSIDVALGGAMISSIRSIFGKIPPNSMGVGRVFRDKGVVFDWIGELPKFEPVSGAARAVPEFVAELTRLADIKKSKKKKDE